MKNAIGIDIGGTKIALGRVTHEGNIVESLKIPFEKSLSPKDMMSIILDNAKGLVDDQTIGIGFGVPGPLNLSQGKMGNPPNLQSWHDFQIESYINHHTELCFKIENDANAAAMAEHLYGQAVRLKNSIYVTISTGIGAGIIINDALLSGSNGNAGEIGHISVDPHSEIICGTCGQCGCLENLASGTAISLLLSKKLDRTITSEEAFNLYRSGNIEAQYVINSAINYLSQAFITLINLFDPDIITIGGGVSQNSDIILPKINDYISKFALSEKGRNVKVVPSLLSNNLGIIGAASLILNKQKS